MGSRDFTRGEAQEIRKLLLRKTSAPSSEQRKIRVQLRRVYDFYSSDLGGPGFGVADFDQLVNRGTIRVSEDSSMPSETAEGSATKVTSHGRAGSDEAYVIDLCDELLKVKAIRQHRFDFLIGDTGTRLPVDAFYPSLDLVIEYHERQHTEPVKLFDQRITVSGVNRGDQRKLYDQRRREVLPDRGLALLEIAYSDLSHGARRRLARDRQQDREVVARMLQHWIGRHGEEG